MVIASNEKIKNKKNWNFFLPLHHRWYYIRRISTSHWHHRSPKPPFRRIKTFRHHWRITLIVIVIKFTWSPFFTIASRTISFILAKLCFIISIFFIIFFPLIFSRFSTHFFFIWITFFRGTFSFFCNFP